MAQAAFQVYVESNGSVSCVSGGKGRLSRSGNAEIHCVTNGVALEITTSSTRIMPVRRGIRFSVCVCGPGAPVQMQKQHYLNTGFVQLRTSVWEMNTIVGKAGGRGFLLNCIESESTSSFSFLMTLAIVTVSMFFLLLKYATLYVLTDCYSGS